MICVCGIHSRPIDYGSINGVEWHTHAAPYSGAVNGYIRLPAGHPWREKAGPELYEIVCPPGHGIYGGPREITYYYPEDKPEWVGFDTLHSLDRWPEDRFGPITLHEFAWTPELVAEQAQSWAKVIAAHV